MRSNYEQAKVVESRLKSSLLLVILAMSPVFTFWLVQTADSPATAAQITADPRDPSIPIEYATLFSAEFIDGDTVHANVSLGFNVFLSDQKLRARDYDAWESNKRRRSAAVDGEVTDAEVAKGKAATKALNEWVAGRSIVVTTDSEKDVYGRWLVSFYVLNKDGSRSPVKDWMKAHGHTRPDSSP
jgi:endonuclease YncB( thermonuclease family)